MNKISLRVLFIVVPPSDTSLETITNVMYSNWTIVTKLSSANDLELFLSQILHKPVIHEDLNGIPRAFTARERKLGFHQ